MNHITSSALTTYLSELLPEGLSWLERMVGINSFTSNAAGVNRLGHLTAEFFAPLGFTAAFVPSTEPTYGSHLYLARGPEESKPVLLVTHLDTVFPPEEEELNDFRWQPALQEDRIYGPGTVDIKGGTILIWMLMHAVRKFAPELFEKTRWVIAANSSEEVIGEDFAFHAREHCHHSARAVLVFEGGPIVAQGYHVVMQRKGRASYRIKAHGKGAHAGSSHAEGVNAIIALANVVEQASRITDYAKALTVNVATIQGGTVLNRVPHEAVAELEMRAFDPAVLGAAQEKVEAFATADVKSGIAQLEVECLGISPAWPASDEALKLIECWRHAAGQLGLSILPVNRGGLSDANYLYTLGPTVDGLGPDGANAHCSERSADGSKTPEFVIPSSFVPKTALNTLAVLKLLENE